MYKKFYLFVKNFKEITFLVSIYLTIFFNFVVWFWDWFCLDNNVGAVLARVDVSLVDLLACVLPALLAALALLVLS